MVRSSSDSSAGRGAGILLASTVEVPQDANFGAVMDHLAVDMQDQRREWIFAVWPLGWADLASEVGCVDGGQTRRPSSVLLLEQGDAVVGGARLFDPVKGQ